MLTRKEMAEAMYAMDILAAKLDGGSRLEDWYRETELGGPAAEARPTYVQTALYEGWLMAKPDAAEAFRNLVSWFVFLLCRKAFGRVEALDGLVCGEEVFS